MIAQEKTKGGRTAKADAVTIERDREAIIGLEKRLEREEESGRDMTVARLAVAQRYSAYASEVIRDAGGNVMEMKTLTDRNNMMPLYRAKENHATVD